MYYRASFKVINSDQGNNLGLLVYVHLVEKQHIETEGRRQKVRHTRVLTGNEINFYRRTQNVLVRMDTQSSPTNDGTFCPTSLA